MILLHPDGYLAGAVWIDLVSPTETEIDRVSQTTGLRVPSEKEISEIESTSRLSFDDGVYYVSTPIPTPDDKSEQAITSVGFVLSSRVLLTVRFGPLPSFDAARSLCTVQKAETAEEAFLHLLEMIVDQSADALEHAGAKCDALSHRAFRSAGAHARTKIGSHDQSKALRSVGSLASRTSSIREGLLGIGRVSAYVMESGMKDAPPVSAARMKAIRADIASLMDYEAQLAGELQFLLDATLGFINIEQNEIVKTLTIASVVGIPPVLVAGIYGMNFRFMPELGWHLGYPMALGAIVISALIPLLWFKRRGWM